MRFANFVEKYVDGVRWVTWLQFEFLTLMNCDEAPRCALIRLFWSFLRASTMRYFDRLSSAHRIPHLWCSRNNSNVSIRDKKSHTHWDVGSCSSQESDIGVAKSEHLSIATAAIIGRLCSEHRGRFTPLSVRSRGGVLKCPRGHLVGPNKSRPLHTSHGSSGDGGHLIPHPGHLRQLVDDLRLDQRGVHVEHCRGIAVGEGCPAAFKLDMS